MTATYTFDVFSTLDSFGGPSPGSWGGYWGKQGPACSSPRLVRRAAADGLRANTYRLFAHFLASGSEESDVHDAWVTRMRSLPATAVSSTLKEPLDWPDATVASGDAVEIIARLKEESNVPLRSHGQTGANPIFRDAADFDLECAERIIQRSIMHVMSTRMKKRLFSQRA